MDRVKVRTGDTKEHPFISVTQLIPLLSRPLLHSTSRQQTPSPKTLALFCASAANSFPFLFSYFPLQHLSFSLFSFFLLLLSFVWCYIKKKKKRGEIWLKIKVKAVMYYNISVATFQYCNCNIFSYYFIETLHSN